jgi:multiple sugar transport system substrate-binding protein
MSRPLTLRGITWDHDRGLRPLLATAAAYAEREPTIRVEWRVRSLQAFADRDVASLAERFDLIVLDHPSIGDAVDRSSLVPLDEHLDAAFLRDQETNNVGRSYESYVWEGHVWALAIDAAAQVASYRPDLLDRLGASVPETWDEVSALSRAAREAGLTVAVPTIPVDAVLAYCAIAVADGVDPFEGEAHGRVAALERLRAIVGVAHPDSSAWNPPATYEHMTSADDVVYCPLAFGYSNYSRADYRGRVLRFAPGPAGGSGVRVGTLGGAGLAVSASSPNVDAAARYAAFVASPGIQRGLYVREQGQPGHRSAWTDPAVNELANGYFERTLPGLDAAYLRPRHAGFLEFQDRAGAEVHRFLVERADDALDAVDRLDAIWAQTSDRTRGTAT